MNISEKQLRGLLERTWELATSAQLAGVNEPALKDAEIDGLIDSAEDIGHGCKCGELAEGPHTCPYKLEINDSDVECDCCAECQYQCSQDI